MPHAPSWGAWTTTGYDHAGRSSSNPRVMPDRHLSMTIGDREPLTNLVPLGGVAKDPWLHPRIAADGSPVLEDGEEVGYRGSHVVEINSFTSGAKHWRTASHFRKPAEMFVATGRVIFTWPQWKRDPGLGGFLERHAVAPLLLERDEGKLILVAHLRPSWIYQVDVHHPSGRFSKTRMLSLRIHFEDELFSFSVKGFPLEQGEDVTRRLASTLASLRLASPGLDGALAEQHGARMTQEDAALDRQTLRAIAAGEQRPTPADWGYSMPIPGSRRVNYVA